MVWLVFALYVVTGAAFKVSVPASHIVAVRGQPAILGCEFTPHNDLYSLVVTWQRKDSRVVHSFYYQQDQLDRQSADYQNRTSLFVSELGNGNASLRIEDVGPRDVGPYLCMVSNAKGTDKAQVNMEYGAFYTEPRLSINYSCSNVTVWYEAEGFPEPEVEWVGDQGQNLSHHTEVKNISNGTEGLLYVKSSYMASSPAVNITFTLKNNLLNQDLQRSLNLTNGEDNARCGERSKVIGLSVTCLILIIVITVLFIFLYKQKATPHSDKAKYQSPARQNGFSAEAHRPALRTDHYINK